MWNSKVFRYSILQFLQKLGFVRKRVITQHFLDRKFRIVAGTIRASPDKDEFWLFALAKRHKVIFDIGSNIGQSALLMLYHDSVEKVVLVDANPEALSFATDSREN